MTTARPIQRGKRYRRLINGLFAVGIVSLLAGMLIEQTLAGLVVYTVAVLGAIGTTTVLQYRSSVSLQDERERELGRRASSITFQLFGYLGLFTFIALFLLDATGRYPMNETAVTLLYAYAVICLTWGAIYTALRYRS
ncbi:DUF2178 domain-containing protein [Halococcus sp. AFM35]|uniref:DUF2178 domain-containing protein n=1 Tax=Halococcus sp. AFM35 TaxID=3421653 RepID=UPI003EC046C9